MKVYLYIYLLILLLSCSSSKGITQEIKINSGYLIKKIKSRKAWYIIYAEKQDTLYKVVAKKEIVSDECKKIAVGKYYDLDLKSRRENAPEINGVKLKPMNYLDIECFSYDEETEICIEPKKGIYDLYYTDDLKGLCYLK